MARSHSYPGSDNAGGFQVLANSFDELQQFFATEFPSHVNYYLFQVVGPVVVVALILYGCLGLLRDLYKWIVPAGAAELHRYVRCLHTEYEIFILFVSLCYDPIASRFI